MRRELIRSMQRELVEVSSGQRLVIRAGEGPAVLLVGPEAQGAAASGPLIAALARQASVFALDPPGFGLSSAPASHDVQTRQLELVEVLDALRLERVGVVGLESGAPLAVVLAREAPERVTGLVLVDALLLDAVERAQLAERGLPSRAPALDGTHVVGHWMQRRAELGYRPWWSGLRSDRREVPLGGESTVTHDLHQVVLDRLDAGADWTAGLRSVCDHDPEPSLAACAVPITALGEVVGSAAGAPEPRPIGEPPAPPALGAEQSGGDSLAATILASLPAAPAPPPPRPRPGPPAERATASRSGGERLAFAQTRAGQLLARRLAGPASHRPGRATLVMLHASPISGEGLLPLARGLAKHRDVVILDTLGNGHSDRPDPVAHVDLHHPKIEAYARVVGEALDDLSLARVDLYGLHTGALIAFELARAEPERIAGLVLDGLPMFGGEFTAELLRDYFVDLAPRWDGTHLQRAWSLTLDAFHFFPWYARDPANRYAAADLTPEIVHRWFVQLARSGTTYPLAYAAAFMYPTHDRLPELLGAAAVCDRPEDMLREYAVIAAERIPRGELLAVPGDPGGDAEAISAYLDGRSTG